MVSENFSNRDAAHPEPPQRRAAQLPTGPKRALGSGNPCTSDGRGPLGNDSDDDLPGRGSPDGTNGKVRNKAVNAKRPASSDGGGGPAGPGTGDRFVGQGSGPRAAATNPGTEGPSAILRNPREDPGPEQDLGSARADLRRLSEMLMMAQENERRRTAIDLYEGLGQSLSVIKLSLENSADQLDAGATDVAQASLRRAISDLQAATGKVRRIAMDLRPAILDDLGILPTLAWLFRDFESVTRGLVVEKMLAISERDVPADLKITLYRVVREALRVIAGHSRADRMKVSLRRDEQMLSLRIEDNGRGFDRHRLSVECLACDKPDCAGAGYAALMERVFLSDGMCRLETAPGSGTGIHAWWSLDQRRELPEPRCETPGRVDRTSMEWGRVSRGPHRVTRSGKRKGA